MHTSRRDILAGAASVGALLALPQNAMAQPSGHAGFAALLDSFADEILQSAPESATGLGLDKGARARLKSRLSDHSLAAAAADRAACQSRLRRLAAFDRNSLSGVDAIRYDAVQYAFQLGADGGAFGYGDNSFGAAMGEYATPYLVSQQGGAYATIPEFLNSQHKIETAADCDAYLARMHAFARQLDQETARTNHDVAAGVVAPDFILDNALGQLTAMRGQAAGETGLVRSLTHRAQAAHIAGDYAARATRIVEREIYPALDRQIAAIRAARARAGHDAGVWRLPRGEDYYAWQLRVGTSTTLSADDIHNMGLEQGRAIDARMDAILRKQGMTEGSVGARVTALTHDPRFVKPNTDAGRAEVVAYCEGRIAAIRALLPRVSHMALRAPVEVHRVPVDIQDGAALGYMNFGALDGSRPAIYYINLKDTGNWPLWTLPTLTAHETIPGHAWQGAYLAEHHDEVPLMSSLMGFNAFVEGWALYAEQLVDELGFYDDDPFGRLGYLQALRFRAARLVVDTGLHAKRWTREQAIQSLIDQTGRAQAAATSEIDRYISTPGQACGYKVGHTEIVRLREKAFNALGAGFDVRDFDDIVVQTGGIPLTVLEKAIDAYIASKLT
ncbi:MAG TPA: DUF885 family protein [Caulobacterales bacterium]|nr:DUF885 family protein [Caulobacterales bacterium]